MSYEGNVEDGLLKLMKEVEQAEMATVPAGDNLNPAPVETFVDERMTESAPIVVAPQLNVEAPSLRQSVEQPVPTIDYEHKFKVMEGMLKARNAEVDAIVAAAELKAEQAENARVLAEQKLAEVPLNYADIMGSDAYDDLGEEAVNGIDKMLAAKLGEALAPKDAEIENLKSIVRNLQDGIEQKSASEEITKGETASVRHDQRVCAEVPDFLAMLKDPKFTSYLETEKDALSGVTMRQIFVEADNAHDSVIVSNICKMYKRSKELSQASAYNKSEHIAPQINSMSPVAIEKPIMTWVEYNKMTSLLLNQSISSSEFDAFNARFELAQSEGRVK